MTDTAGARPLEFVQADDAYSQQMWEHAAAGVLRKSGRMTEADPDDLVWEKLAHTGLDGIGVTPLGISPDSEGISPNSAVRPPRAGAWDIRSLVAGNAAAANEDALADLDGGVTSLWLADADDLAARLDGVLLDLAPVVVDGRLATAEALVAFADEKGVTLHPETNFGAGEQDLVPVVRLAQQHGVRGAVVDALAVHDRGASDAQELGYSMAVAVSYLRTLADAGLDVVDAAGLVEFRYAATVEQFPTIAKLRAARRLWARVLELCGADPDAVAQRQHAVTSRPMLSQYDPYVNMLRGTVAAFAAGVGGADAVTVLPFDAPLGRPDAFGRRIARNVNHLLIEESHVAAVADPAAGSYAVEKLTADLAEAAWAEFGRIDDSGYDAFEERVAATVARRDEQVADGTRPITGLTVFPNPDEPVLTREPDPLNDAVRRYGAAAEEARSQEASQ